MPERSKIIEELNFLSDILSQRVRAFSVGVLVFCWAFVFEGKGLSIKDLMVPGSFAVLALLLDSAQYAAGILLNMVMLRRMRRENKEAIAYDRKHPLYRARQVAFPLKIISVAISIISLFWLLIDLYWASAVSH